jgi:hypothetical protein
MADDRLQAAWRRHFSLMPHPHVPVLQSLIEADDKLNAAVGFLEPLSPDIEAEREQGTVVASVAIGYALKLLGKRCQDPLLTLPALITYCWRLGATSSRRRGQSKLRTLGNELTPDSSLREAATFHRVRTDYLGISDHFLAYCVMPSHFHLLLWQKRAAGGKRGRDSYSSGFDGSRGRKRARSGIKRVASPFPEVGSGPGAA